MSKLEELLSKIINMADRAKTFDATQFNDPIALKTDWSPAKRGGANFRTHKLVNVNTGRYAFKSSLGAKIFYSIFSLTGIAFLIVWWMPRLEEGYTNFDNFDMWMPFLIGVVFSAAGGLMYYFGSQPIVFDRGSGFYWKGWKNPENVMNISELKNCVKLKNVHAIQLISEYVRGNKTTYFSYELNLVLKDGSRLNVIDHGNKNRLIEDAERLSRFLDKPLWNPFGA